MSLFKEYNVYLRNNPQGYWFKRKLYGYGWIPATKQGWAVLVVYVSFVIGFSLWAERHVADSQAVTHVIIPMLLATSALLLITYQTGEPLRWQWGNKMENKSQEHFVYILKCADKTLYTGYTCDLKKRLSEHNGKSKVEGAKYTRSRRPVKLMYSEVFESRSEAQQREYAVKQLSRPQKLLLIKESKSST